MFFRHWSIGRKLAAVLASILVLFMGSSALSLPGCRSSPWAVDFELNLHPARLGLQGHVTEFRSRTLGVKKWNLEFLTFCCHMLKSMRCME